ncbi:MULTISPECIES: GUN4 domain-containing protein [unclassified Nostoc]|uniref:GUN4 domain-containing protein n=1 Tax=unclassified Nostoc TaxID=2593658 RepID=UPI002AD1DFA5|nr:MULTISPECIES: GUN4 domain-containing protein [unclassified Nostoc]MDZ8031143.1 GUN4 domain-containing protein [Nostoc sp. DedSLP04]MDZ8136256.1 GUN4 domain-containing protein [Nostoc sp. DedQUE04]
MLTKQQRQLITYKSISIYERTYQLPILKNHGIETVQKKIRERQRLIKEGVRYHHKLGGIIKRKEKISQGEIFDEIQLFIKDYNQIIVFLNSYKDSYHNFLLNLINDLKELFKQKYLTIKNLEDERSKIELKNYKNPQILNELRWEKEENFKAVLLLSNAYFLMLEKISLLSEGIKKLAEDLKKQKEIVQQIVEDLDTYQELYEYQSKAYKIRQEIAKIAQTAINFENSLQDYFSPFQSLIDEFVKIDEYFYATVGDIKNLGDNILKYQSNLFNLEEAKIISETFLDFMVTSYDKKTRLKDAFIQSKLLDWQIYNLDSSENFVFLDKGIDLIANYISKQLTDQRKMLGIAEVDFVSTVSLSNVEETGLMELTDNNLTLTKEFFSNKDIDYTQLRYLLSQHKWKEADIETAKLMLKAMKKNYWNEVYKEDIDNFCCQDIHTIDELWEQYSYGYFGFSVQQTIWSEMGGQVDYETEKRLGDRLGWRKEGNWLDYEQLTFKLSPMTPMGHLPAKWLHYDQHSSDLSLSSTEHLSMGAWRVKSWLVWQMHLFFSRTKICSSLKII